MNLAGSRDPSSGLSSETSRSYSELGGCCVAAQHEIDDLHRIGVRQNARTRRQRLDRDRRVAHLDPQVHAPECGRRLIGNPIRPALIERGLLRDGLAVGILQIEKYGEPSGRTTVGRAHLSAHRARGCRTRSERGVDGPHGGRVDDAGGGNAEVGLDRLQDRHRARAEYLRVSFGGGHISAKLFERLVDASDVGALHSQ